MLNIRIRTGQRCIEVAVSAPVAQNSPPIGLFQSVTCPFTLVGVRGFESRYRSPELPQHPEKSTG